MTMFPLVEILIPATAIVFIMKLIMSRRTFELNGVMIGMVVKTTTS